jgi:hypothetical protein
VKGNEVNLTIGNQTLKAKSILIELVDGQLITIEGEVKRRGRRKAKATAIADPTPGVEAVTTEPTSDKPAGKSKWEPKPDDDRFWRKPLDQAYGVGTYTTKGSSKKPSRVMDVVIWRYGDTHCRLANPSKCMNYAWNKMGPFKGLTSRVVVTAVINPDATLANDWAAANHIEQPATV